MKPKDPVREKPRAVNQTGRCPFCGEKVRKHCASALCSWLSCSSKRCCAYGPGEAMVLP